mmetsp:Transcript_140173/g.244135  ORF Transcript_140173/g.244135 Transcript_140173/m.244135 type:complete len:224 (-) Transcript_140173:526-1197(-)
MGHRDMCRVHHVLHEEVPPVRQVPQIPGRGPRTAIRLMCNELRDQPWGLLAGLTGGRGTWRPGLAPHPQDALPLLRGVGCGAGLRQPLQPAALLRARLGEGHTGSLPIEAPGVVSTQQTAILLDPPLAQRGPAVGAGVLKHTPGPSPICPSLVPPDHELLPQQLCTVRAPFVQDLSHVQGPPLLGPADCTPAAASAAGIKVVGGPRAWGRPGQSARVDGARGG